MGATGLSTAIFVRDWCIDPKKLLAQLVIIDRKEFLHNNWFIYPKSVGTIGLLTLKIP